MPFPENTETGNNLLLEVKGHKEDFRSVCNVQFVLALRAGYTGVYNSWKSIQVYRYESVHIYICSISIKHFLNGDNYRILFIGM